MMTVDEAMAMQRKFAQEGRYGWVSYGYLVTERGWESYASFNLPEEAAIEDVPPDA